ncbi:MAG TPA: hypothetical protein VFQ89_01730, partial [Candidatus Binatia bacterium]|nr:hypothetical protein [Candidatus Binatia bacterium]
RVAWRRATSLGMPPIHIVIAFVSSSRNIAQRAQLAYQTAMKALARHTGYNVRQVAKFMQSRRRAQKQD